MRQTLFAVSCALAALCKLASAAELPLWEVGAGLAVFGLPDYRGSDEQRGYVLPIPYVVYRGDRLKVDRQSLRGVLFKTERAELDLSLNASPPVDSGKNEARAGMPDLDPTFELGPSLKLALLAPSDRGLRVALVLPIRAVYATDLSRISQAGYVFSPRLNIDGRLGDAAAWNIGVSIGPIYNDRRLNAYYYGVDPAFATTHRPAFQAKGGYAGSQLTLGVSRRFERFWVGAFARADDLGGASISGSPLTRKRTTFMFGFAVSWILATSRVTVSAEE